MTVQQDMRTYLAQYFTDMAEWYDRPLREPNGSTSEDRRLHAGFYHSFADHIRALPDDDLRLVALARLTGIDSPAGFSPGPRVGAAIANIGRFAGESPEPYLENLVHAALDDHLDADNHTTTILIESISMNGSRA
ncbi:hypothetical protein BH23CHL2_BH23CHL2_17510 [soil metagenome]